MRSAFVALLALLPLSVAAQADAVQRPDVKVGDRWTYQRMDYWNNSVLDTYETRSVFYPDTGMLRFPLRQGISYKVAYESVFGQHRNFRARHDRVARVIGWEDVSVPAGKFRALKIELAGSFSRLDTSLSGKARNIVWYAPEVKRWVKVTYDDWSHLGPFNRSGEELVSFQVQ